MEGKYLFLFGNTPQLGLKELESFFTNCKISIENLEQFSLYALVNTSRVNFQDVLNQLGCTVKIARVLGDDYDEAGLEEAIYQELKKVQQKVVFGISSPDKSISQQGLLVLKAKVKGKLSLIKKGIRFIDSPGERDLSSVVIAKEKVSEFLIFGRENKFLLAKTIAVQNYEYWSKADFGRPFADPRSGMLPPKIARAMVNLSQKSPCNTKENRTLLDPFCGMGTILQEGLANGFATVGNDFSPDVIKRTQKNLEWYEKEFKPEKNFSLFTADAVHLSQLPLPEIDCIVTEGYMGPTLEIDQEEVFTSGRKEKLNTEKLKNIYKGLEKLYIGSLREWKKVLKKDGKVVIIFPSFHLPKFTLKPEKIIDKISNLGYSISYGPLEYSRPGASIIRNIYLLNNLP